MGLVSDPRPSPLLQLSYMYVVYKKYIKMYIINISDKSNAKKKFLFQINQSNATLQKHDDCNTFAPSIVQPKHIRLPSDSLSAKMIYNQLILSIMETSVRI